MPAHRPRPVFIYFGPWGETLSVGKRGLTIPSPGSRTSLDKPVVQVAGYVNHLHCPPFVPEVLERSGSKLVMRDPMGEIVECIEGKSGIPKFCVPR
ncbi:MAG: hypothetical protein ACLSB9_17265 [Hydrogeniiclostridium mannosilyticum]